MADFTLDPAAATRLSDRACAVAAVALRRATTREVLVLPENRRLEWTDLTKKFSQNVHAFKHVTDLTLAFDPRGETTGWKIEERLAACTDEVLPEGAIEKLARRAEFVAPASVAEKGESVPLPPNRFYQRVVFADGATRREVLVNPASGAIIGTLPLLSGLVAEPPGQEASPAAWNWVTAYIAKRGGVPIPQKKLQELFHLSVVGTQRAATGGQLQQLRLWAHLTHGEVRLAADSGETLSWSFEALLSARGATQTTEAEALALARNEFREAKENGAPRMEKTRLNGAELLLVAWEHRVGQLLVEADHCSVTINTASKLVAGYARKWKTVPPALLAPPKCSADEAMGEVQRRRGELKIADAFQAKLIGECIVEVALQPDTPSAVNLYRVWRIGLTAPNNPSFTEVAVDRFSGQIVRVTGW